MTYAMRAKPVFFEGRALGSAATLSGAAMLANHYGASVGRSQHDGRHVVIEGPDRFSVEDRV